VPACAGRAETELRGRVGRDHGELAGGTSVLLERAELMDCSSRRSAHASALAPASKTSRKGSAAARRIVGRARAMFERRGGRGRPG